MRLAFSTAPPRSLTRHERDVKVFYEAAGLALLLVGLGVLCAWTVGLFTAQEVDTSSWDRLAARKRYPISSVGRAEVTDSVRDRAREGEIRSVS